MNKTTQELNKLIDDFLGGELDAEQFESSFTSIFDFVEIEDNGLIMEYFSSVRKILERFTFSENDLKSHPNYYIDSLQLKNVINTIKKEKFHS